jgi:hypothetical protein
VNNPFIPSLKSWRCPNLNFMASQAKHENSEFLCDHNPIEYDGWAFKNRLHREAAAFAVVAGAARCGASPSSLSRPTTARSPSPNTQVLNYHESLAPASGRTASQSLLTTV